MLLIIKQSNGEKKEALGAMHSENSIYFLNFLPTNASKISISNELWRKPGILLIRKGIAETGVLRYNTRRQQYSFNIPDNID